MSRVVFVEVLDRRGRPRSRHRFSSLPISIGRAYTNDLIIDDRYVSPEQFRVVETEDGRLLAQDLESLNGLYVFGRSGRELQVALRSGLTLRIGETHLRFVESDEPVPPAKPMAGASRGLAGRVGTRTASLLAIAFSFGVFTLYGYLTLATAFRFAARGVWLVGLLTGHLAVVGSLSPRRRLGWATGVVGGIIVLALLFHYVHNARFSSDIPASVPLKALGASWLPTQSMDDFVT